MKQILVYVLIALVLFPTYNYAQINKRTNTVPDSVIEYVQGDILIKFKAIPGKSRDIKAARQKITSKYNTNIVKQWKTGAEHWEVDTLLPNYNLLQIIDSLNANPYIEYAEPNYILRADVIPNDPQFGDQWALNNTGQNGGTPDADIDASEAWDITTGDTNVVVGIIDTGIDYDHPDLAENIWTNRNEIPDNGIDDDNNGYIDDIHGWDFCNNDNDPMDDNLHGTHVAGTIGAVSNNGVGIAGVAWNVRLMALKFLNANSVGETSDAVSAIEYANNMGVKITNNSWGGGEFSQTLYDIIATSDSLGSLFIAASGNSASDNDYRYSPHYPANYDLNNIISVASTDQNDSLSVFSCYGLTTVDIAAPGTSILSTFPNNSYESLDGTSMATPHVSGASALIWSRFPDFTHHQVKSQILGSTDLLSQLSEKCLTEGRLNLFNSVVDTNFLLFTCDQIVTVGAQYVDSTTSGKTISITNVYSETVYIDSLWIGQNFPISIDDITYYGKLYSLPVQAGDSLKIFIRFHPTDTIRFENYLNIYAQNSNKHLYTRIIGYGINSGTIISDFNIYGEWNASNSPYYINNDIDVSEGNILKIFPGVEVLFTGHYKMKINHAQFAAIGTREDSIIFTAIDKDIGWKGIELYGGINNLTDSIIYCSINYAKVGGGISATSVNLFVDHCEIFQNTSSYGGGIYFAKGNFTFRNLNIHHNKAINIGGGGSGGGLATTLQPSTMAIMDSIILSNNHAEVIGGALYLWQGEFYLSNIQILDNNCDGEYAAVFTGCDIGINNMLIAGNNFSPNHLFTSIFANSTSSISNLTFANNGGTLRFNGGQTILKNAIVYNSSLPEIDILNIDNVNSSLDILYSSITDSISSFDISDPQISMTAMTYGDPGFVSTTDLHLSDSSFCIDKGDPSDDVGYELFPNGYRINMGYYGGTSEAALSSGIAVNIQPKPLDFGKVSGTKLYTDTLWIMNGGSEIAILNDIVNNDTSSLALSYSIVSDTLISGQTIPVQVVFNPSLLGEGLYESGIGVVLEDIGLVTVPVLSEVYTGTVIDSSNVHGTWYLANSPYKIIRDIYIPSGNSLTIEPGVRVYFGGDFDFTVGQNAMLIGKGNAQDSLIFSPYLCDSWKGLSFINSNNDDTLSYFRFEKARSLIGHGGGIRINNSSPVISNAVISSCRAYEGGGLSINNSSVRIESCHFHNNAADYQGGAIFADSSTVYLSQCDFINNYSVRIGGSIALSYCSLYGNHIYASLNRAVWSSFMEAYSSYTIEISNSVIADNYLVDNPLAESSALFRSSVGNFSLHNTTIANNSDRVFYSVGGTTSFINNCIIRGNIQQQFLLDPYSHSTNITSITNCNIDDGQNSFNVGNSILNWGVGNIDTIPEFIDSSYWLAATSSCIDAGINDSVFSSTDFDGNLRIWDGNGNGTAIVDMGAYEYGAPLAQFHDIELSPGWNIFSSFVNPMDNDMLGVLDPIISSSQLIKAIDESGGFVQQIPGIGWMNTIGNIENTEGYYIKSSANCTLSLVGTTVPTPFTIPLQTGWNIMGYPMQNGQDALTALQGIINNGSLTKVINESGGFIQNIPGLGWLNTIGSFQPGEGYYIKVSENDTLTLSESFTKMPEGQTYLREGEYFLRESSGNPYQPMHIVATFDNSITLEPGDELGVFAHDVCIGSGYISDASAPVVTFLTTNDPTTELIDGGQTRDVLQFKLFHLGQEYDLITHEQVNYEPLETKVLNFTATGLDISENNGTGFNVSEVIPNPFSRKARIYVNIPETGTLKIELLDLRGVVIKSLFDSEVHAQKLEIKIEGDELKQGMYFVHVQYKNDWELEDVLRKVVVHSK